MHLLTRESVCFLKFWRQIMTFLYVRKTLTTFSFITKWFACISHLPKKLHYSLTVFITSSWKTGKFQRTGKDFCISANYVYLYLHDREILSFIKRNKTTSITYNFSSELFTLPSAFTELKIVKLFVMAKLWRKKALWVIWFSVGTTKLYNNISDSDSLFLSFVCSL